MVKLYLHASNLSRLYPCPLKTQQIDDVSDLEVWALYPHLLEAEAKAKKAKEIL